MIGGGIFLVLLLFGVYRIFLGGGMGLKSTLHYTPRDLRVVQGLKDALVTWKSDASYSSVVEYGPDEKKLAAERGAKVDESDHTVKLGDLRSGKKYYYRVIYPNGEKSLPYSFNMVEADFRFSMSLLEDKGVRVEGETTVPAKAILHYVKGGKELTATPTEGEGFELNHMFKIEGANPESIRKVRLQFHTSEAADVPGDKIRLR
jgi:hypothetical protein